MTATSGGGAAEAALRAFFFRVPEDAEDFCGFGIAGGDVFTKIDDSCEMQRRVVSLSI